MYKYSLRFCFKDSELYRGDSFVLLLCSFVDHYEDSYLKGNDCDVHPDINCSRTGIRIREQGINEGFLTFAKNSQEQHNQILVWILSEQNKVGYGYHGDQSSCSGIHDIDVWYALKIRMRIPKNIFTPRGIREFLSIFVFLLNGVVVPQTEY